MDADAALYRPGVKPILGNLLSLSGETYAHTAHSNTPHLSITQRGQLLPPRSQTNQTGEWRAKRNKPWSPVSVRCLQISYRIPKMQCNKARSETLVFIKMCYNKLYAGGHHGMPPPLSSPRERRSAFRRRADGNVAAVSHGQHVLMPPLQPPDAPTWRWAKRPGDLDLWPFDLCPSHVWRGLPLCQFWSS